MSAFSCDLLSRRSLPLSEWLVGVFLFALPFQGASQLLVFSGSAVRYLALAVCMTCLCDSIVHGKVHVGTLTISLLVFLALVLLSCLWSIDSAASRTEVMSIGGYLLTAIAIAMTPRTAAARKRLALVVVLGGVTASVVVAASSLAQGGLVRETLVGVASASDPNNFAASLLLPLAIAASAKKEKWPLRLVTSGILVVGILATGSRGGLIGALIVLGVSINWGRQGKAVLAGILEMAIVVAAVWVAAASLFPALLSRLTYAELQWGRLQIWPIGLRALGRYGSTGTGIGTFPDAYNAVGAGSAGYSRAAHNIFLQIGVELGVPGLVLFCLVVLLAIRRARSSRAGTAAILGVLAASFLLGTLELAFFWVTLLFPFLDSDSVLISVNDRVSLRASIGRAAMAAPRCEPVGCDVLTSRPESSDLLSWWRHAP